MEMSQENLYIDLDPVVLGEKRSMQCALRIIIHMYYHANYVTLPFLKANVMLEYSIEEAETLLSKNLNAAQKSLTEIEEDLGFLRDQYTTTEVSIL